MTEELRIKESKSIACHGFIDFLQEIIAHTKEGWTLDLRSQFCPQFMIGIFCANFYKLEEEPNIDTVFTNGEMASGAVADNVTKPKRAYTKKDEMKAQLTEKLGEQAKSIRDVK